MLGPVLGLEYHHPDHGPVFEVISKVVRSSGKFTARSHFRFGYRESFDHQDVRQVLALPSLAVEPCERFFKGAKRG